MSGTRAEFRWISCDGLNKGLHTTGQGVVPVVSTSDEKAISLHHELCEGLVKEYEVRLFEGGRV